MEKVEKAREFCEKVKQLSRQYNLSFFVVTEGASATSNSGCEAVKNARDNHIKWELENNLDPNEDWSQAINKEDEDMKFNKLIPELSVTDIAESKQFYLNIGFKIKYERPENKFCFLELEENQIMIEELNDNWNTGVLEYPFGRGINISMEVINFDKVYKNIQENKYPLFKDIMYNQYEVNGEIYTDREFLIQDPDGYLLRFNES